MPALEFSGISSGLSTSEEWDANRGGERLKDNASTSNIYTAKRFAIKFQPPCLFLEYFCARTQKTRVRAVKLNNLSVDMDVDRLTRKVIRSFPRKLDPSSVKYDQVRKLVYKLVERLHTTQQDSFIHPRDLQLPQDRSAPRSPIVSPKLEPGGVSPLRAFKNSNGALRGAERDSTESQFSTSDLGSSRGPNGKHRHQDLDETMLQLDRELGFKDETSAQKNLISSCQGQSNHQTISSGLPSPSHHVEPAAAHAQSNSRSRFKQEAEEQTLTLDIDINENTDLNRVSEVELRLAKEQMEREFTKHQLKPGDPGYEYDKQIEFGPPTSANDWDEDDDDG